jgi:uncharacterized protein YyaL (SSP411 family)
MSQNQLARETSPYLLQHADNPVHWQPWGPEALARAKREDKPILLSVGYAACHWCHVMAHESFESEAIAAVMNDRFVNIKVDREERPDLDTIYMNALHLMGQQGGWPLTMFLTPDGHPFWGGTYFPPESRYGRPGFKEVLVAISEFYRDKKDRVAEAVTQLKGALGQLAQSQAGRHIPIEVNDEAAHRLAQQFDKVEGGIGGAPKFPNPPILEVLWRGWIRSGDASARDAVLLTLDKMSQGGIYDHLGGGYARYSTDAKWLVPHFEKMLYDNAQLLDLLAWAWRETGNPLYEARAHETVAWTLREMLAEGGGFASSLDADSEGEEGKFYVWTAAEIDRVLGADADLFKRAYDVTADGNWEGHTILNRNHGAGPFGEPEEMRLAICRATLLAERAKRVRPGWDDKVLADWNGLMIAALANAALAFAVPRWREAAATAFDFIVGRMSDGDRLLHSYRRGQAKNTAHLDDYANMCRAALALHEATGAPEYLDRAKRWVAVFDRHYWDDDAGGYFFTADDAEALIVRVKNAHDNATPSGNGTMAGVLATLYYLTGSPAYRERAEALIAAFAGEVARNFFPLASLLNGSELLQRAAQIIVVGRRGEASTDELVRAAFKASLPTRVISVVAPGGDLPSNHPARGKGQIAGSPTAYVCVGATCSLPQTSAEALAQTLASAFVRKPKA